jgi:hypothetical protein
MLMQPSPIAETSRLLVPSLRFFIFVKFADIDSRRTVDLLVSSVSIEDIQPAQSHRSQVPSLGR